MASKLKRITSGILAALMLSATLTGCGETEEPVDIKVVSLPPEEQVLQDSYKQNPKIDEWMTYTTDVATYITNEGMNNEKVYVSLWKLFDVHAIQIDCMDLLYLGKSTMGDVAQHVDDANKAAIEYATESVRATRQAKIDAEYNEAKAAAEAKGKTYNREKKVADISDLDYVEPYRYVLAYDNTDNQTKEQNPYIWDEYLGSKLIDPSVNNTMYLFIYKYDVPYVQCTFKNVQGSPTYSSYGSGGNTTVKMYNNLIDQERDWVMTGIAPADCSFLVDLTTLYVPPYVDEDWNSKGSKNNMVTNGNIKFGGEGFTWDSLMTLCDALELTMTENAQNSWGWRGTTTEVSNTRACTYQQTSDDKFTYYTIYLPINHFFQQSNGDLSIPLATITVTFNKETNNCINWNIDYSQYYHCFPATATHLPGEVVSVNVRSHKIDTADYTGMLQTINDWVAANATNAEFGYYFVDETGTVIGKIDNGLSNYHVEVVVNGETYYCTKAPSDNSAMQGYYISQSERAKLFGDGVAENEVAVFEASKLYYIMCMAVTTNANGKSTPVGYFNNTGILINDNKEPSGYYIHSIDYDEQTGYKNAVIIDTPVYDKLYEMYIRTFRFSAAMQENVEKLYEAGDPLTLYKYVQKYVTENEKAKDKIQQQISNDVQSQTSKPTTVIKAEQGSLDTVVAQQQ